MLPIVLEDSVIKSLMEKSQSSAEGYELTVDLQNEEIYDGEGFRIGFKTDPFRREFLLKGLDDIGMTLEMSDKILEFERANQ